MPSPSDRIKEIVPSKSLEIALKVLKLREEGHDVIGLHVGEADFDTPSTIIKSTQKALSENKTKYDLVQGNLELRQSIAQRFNYLNQGSITPQNIILGNGSKHILYNIFQSLLNPGDEVIIPRPYWVTFPESVKLAGGVPRFVAPSKGFQLDLDGIREAVGPKTKALVINSPNNPSGVIYPPHILSQLLTLAKEHDFMIISDEAYEGFIYDGERPFSLYSLDKKALNNTITVQSFSKTFSMTGFRIGYAIASNSWVTHLKNLGGHQVGNICTFAQYGALEALSLSEGEMRPYVHELQERRDLAFNLFSSLFDCYKPQGGFCLFPNISKYIEEGRFTSSQSMALEILEKAHVAVLPGEAFGLPEHLRLSFTPSKDDIKNAFQKIKDFL
ncbi:MAG: aminotransferase class I and II [Halobacteriovoraceae bacterium]|nr:aminotransferase class I and II [Halobacteriovoraceae bacterium]